MSSTPPLDTIVLVTGVNGFLGSHIADQFLIAGFRVRELFVQLPRQKILEKVFVEKHAKGRFEVISVPDITVDGAFDAAVKGIKQPHREEF